MGSAGKMIASLLRCRRGVSALEFALVAPMLCFGLLSMVDIGRAFAVRMELDRNVRAGAQAAMTLEQSPSQVAAVVQLAAGAATPTVDVTMQCTCGATTWSCETFCNTGQPPSVFFHIRASRPHPGAFLSQGPIVSSARVKVR